LLKNVSIDLGIEYKLSQRKEKEKIMLENEVRFDLINNISIIGLKSLR